MLGCFIHKEDNDSDAILVVKKPEFTECPTLPVELEEWVEKGWSKIDGDVKVKASISKTEKNTEIGEEKLVQINFDDDKKRTSLFESWKEKRELWVNKEVQARKVDEIFNMFYTLYSILKKEAEAMELVLGDGILTSSDEKKIHHHYSSVKS